MGKLSIFILIISFSFALPSRAQTTSQNRAAFTPLDAIVAVVNREPITQSQLTKEMDKTKKQLEQTNQPVPSYVELRQQVLDALIAKNLQLQLSRTKNIVVKEDELNKAISHVASANKFTPAQLKEAIEHTGITYEDYRKQIGEQILLQKLQQEEVAKGLSFTPDDVNKFLRENKDKLNMARYSTFHVLDIVMPIAENASSVQLIGLKKQAENCAQQLRKGKPIEDLLKEFPYADQNDLGWRSLGEFPSLFQSKVAEMNINSVSMPIPAPNGIHILKLIEAKGENPKPSQRDLKNLAFQYKISLAVKDWIKKLRQEAYVQVMN